MTSTTVPVNLELRFQPTVELISSTRRFVQAYFQPLISDPDVVSRIGLATHELLENILKYATDGRTVTRVDLVDDGDDRTLSIETTSAVTPERRAGLEEIFTEMANASDALSYYQLTMGRARHRRQGSGLGLARIWAEAEMTLSIGFSGDSVTIRAIATLSAEDAS
jgi:two-component sensor histidine kinase